MEIAPAKTAPPESTPSEGARSEGPPSKTTLSEGTTPEGTSSESTPPRSLYRERPDYRVDLLARTNVMTAWLGDVRLARSDACLIVDEQDHGLVVYFPPDAVDLARLEPVAGLSTVCPFKGRAVYWRAADTDGPAVAWSYPAPFPQVARLAGFIAFDQDEVQVTIGKGIYTGARP
ncbi:DUF427 domain-containing protein [Actinomadura parmotrematis]|uniref:DUF427 domain-containing protein n=1 Tax=Actinomadura parmotrematis TaxID=2864039 RepID=A0ABS7G0Z0_9ACTN|nr:DUF427 domain-containing protein [Actinomadura parmotrematis]MBW8486382.1 DUF427 domain-containing protein [Actinomadura parmotrematis]